MKFNINIKMIWNVTKFIAFASLVAATYVTLKLKDPSVIISTFGFITALLINRDYQDRKKPA